MIKKIENKIAEIMKHYGLGDCEASIIATLSTHGEMTAKEIAEKTGYAYSTIVNSLNYLRRIGFVKKGKINRLCIYSTDLDFIKMIEEDRKKLSNLLDTLREEIKIIEDKYKDKLSNLVLKIENALKYLKKLEEAC